MSGPYLNFDGTVCCGDDAWRGHLCSYHQGWEDGRDQPDVRRALASMWADDLLASLRAITGEGM